MGIGDHHLIPYYIVQNIFDILSMAIISDFQIANFIPCLVLHNPRNRLA
jgi:hypothetical protein